MSPASVNDYSHHMTPEQEARFWAKVDRSGDCWIWTAGRAVGYGVMHVATDYPGRHWEYAHRLSYMHHHGAIPAGMFIDHACHEPTCVNPAHLRLTTSKQNGENRVAPPSNNTSGVRGVWWDKARGKWVASVTHNGRKNWVGSFDNIEEAAQAVKEKRCELFTHNDHDRQS